MTFVAVHAAAEKKRQEEAEEEQMAGYGTDDLGGDWEFKIVRSTMGGFDNPAKLQEVVDAEAIAGWQLLEKFDGYRLRFKRPMSARAEDELLPPDVDPYRTQVGWGAGAVGLTAAFLAIVLVVLLAGLVVSAEQAGPPDVGPPVVLAVVVALAVVFVLGIVVRRRR